MQEKNLFSNARLNKYKSFKEYKENIIFSQNMYADLSILEVCLRNKINNYLVKFDCDWLKNNTTTGNNFLVEKAIRNLENNRKVISNNSLVPELSLGFWVNMFSSKKKGFVFNKRTLKKTFGEDFNIPKSVFYKKLEVIRKFRNRIFHYEKVINDERFSNIENQISEILQILDPELLNLVKEIKQKKWNN